MDSGGKGEGNNYKISSKIRGSKLKMRKRLKECL